MVVMRAEGEPLRDIIDWLWLADGAEVRLVVRLKNGTIGTDGTGVTGVIGGTGGAGVIGDTGIIGVTDVTGVIGDTGATSATERLLTRDWGEDWGIRFADPLFEGLMTCRNSCVFCFMTMLPEGLRPSLYERDDDYRLSFLQGNFVTLTNLGEKDLQRIIDRHLSPLHVSLHAINPNARLQLMGKNHAHSLEALERLLDAGIETHAQIVLLPNINDADELDATLAWIEQRPRILSAGIVPYGFTRYARLQESFDAAKARQVIARVAPWQERSRQRDGSTRFQLADEWYLLADAPLPPAEHYDGFPQFEDGIGMLRAFEDEWPGPQGGDRAPCGPLPAAPPAILVTGEAFAPTLRRLVADSVLSDTHEVLAIRNRFFGGNVNVAGLLTAQDIIAQLREYDPPREAVVVLPSVLFNADGLTLDDKRAKDIAQALERQVVVVRCTGTEAEVLRPLGTYGDRTGV
jgi:putative radical SAM enzyme (TIGR03279 family)